MTFESSGTGSIGTVGEKDILAHKLEFDRNGVGGLLMLHIVNIVFMVLTFFVYRFWALTRVRRALWPRMRFDGSPLEYTGTGLEIFIGFLKVFLLILLPYGIFSNWVNSRIIDPEIGFSFLFALLSYLSVLGIAFLYSAARYLAYRYRVNRTHWRGIRGSVDGAAYMYALISFGCYFLVFITFGIMKPWMDVKLLQYKLDHTKFGGQQFWFAGTTEGLWRPYLLFLLMPLIVLFAFVDIDGGIISIRFSFQFNSSDSAAAIHWQSVGIVVIGAICSALAYLNYQIQFWKKAAGRLTFGAAHFSFQPTIRQVFSLYIGNWLLTCLSLWILLPLAWLRKGSFLARHLTITGDLNVGALVQAEFDTDAKGEGFLGDFDIA